MEIVKALLTALLGIRGCGPMICNILKGIIKLEKINSAGEDRLRLGIIASAGEDILSWGRQAKLGNFVVP